MSVLDAVVAALNAIAAAQDRNTAALNRNTQALAGLAQQEKTLMADLAALTAGLLERGATGLYNSAALNMSVGEAAELVARVTGARVIERHQGSDPRDYAMDTSKLDRIARPWWAPRSLEDSIGDLIVHYRQCRLTARDVVTRRYHRLVQYRARTSTLETASAK